MLVHLLATLQIGLELPVVATCRTDRLDLWFLARRHCGADWVPLEVFTNTVEFTVRTESETAKASDFAAAGN